MFYRVAAPIYIPTHSVGCFPAGSVVKNPLVVQEMQIRPLGGENPLEESMATHSSLLACRIPRREAPEGYGPLGHRELAMTVTAEQACMHTSV